MQSRHRWNWIPVILLSLVAAPLAGCRGQAGDSQPEAPEGKASAAQASSNRPSEEVPYVRLPAIDAYYQGQKIWFIHTEVSDAQMAQRLTEMVDYPTVYAPQLGSVDPAKAGRIYVFKNGVSRSDAQPWGGGPFHYQIDIFDSVPGDENYTPLRNPHLVTWKEEATPRVLRSEAELLEAQRNGELTIEPTPVVVNAPVVHPHTDVSEAGSR